MIRHILLIFGTLLIGIQGIAQDPIFSQFYAAPLQINPAFAGNTEAAQININYRNQWPFYNNAYSTYAASYSQYFKAVNSGLGAYIQVDDAGDGTFKTTKFSGIYAYRLKISEQFFVKFGAEASGTQVALDWSQLRFGDQADQLTGFSDINGNPFPTEEIQPDDLSKTYFDVSSGILFVNPYFYAGFSGKHLNTPNETIFGVHETLSQGLAVRWSIHGGTQIDLFKKNKYSWPMFLSPNIAFIKQGDFAQLDVGTYFGLGMFFAGAWYRHAYTNPDAGIISLGFQKDVLKIGYSMDFSVSELSNYSNGGAHEISLSINMSQSDKFKRKRISERHNDCLSLFR